jgi:DNA polymerase-4
LSDPTQLARRIFDCGRELLARETDGTKFRLIGIGVSGLQSSQAADPGNLLDPDASKTASSEYALDTLRAKFGRKVVIRGIALRDEGDT